MEPAIKTAPVLRDDLALPTSDAGVPMAGFAALPDLRARATRSEQPMHALVGVLLALLSALLVSLAYTATDLGRIVSLPIDLGFLAWFGLAPYLVALRRTTRIGFVMTSLTFGAAFVGLTCAWLGSVHELALVGLTIGAAIHFLWTGIFVRATLRWHAAWAVITVPLVWIYFEWLLGLVLFKFPWFLVGYTQLGNPWVSQVAELGGVWAVSFLVVAANLAIANIGHAGGDDPRFAPRRVVFPTILAMALVLAGHVFGVVRLDELSREIDTETGPVVALLQPAVPQGLKLEQEGTEPTGEQIMRFEWRMLDAISGFPNKGVHTASATGPMYHPEARITVPDDALHETFLVARMTDAPIDLVCFPESSIPFGYSAYEYFRQHPDVGQPSRVRNVNEILAATRHVNDTLVDAESGRSRAPSVLISTLDYARPEDLEQTPPERWFDEVQQANTTALVSGDGELLDRYIKFELVPVGEYIPLGEHTDLFRDYTKQITKRKRLNELAPGRNHTVYDIGSELGPSTIDGAGKFSTSVCFESNFPELHRRFALGGARFTINVSNDGWFLGSSELEQIWLIGRMRAIETRTAYVRCVNSGISGIAAPDGSLYTVLEGPAGLAPPHPALGERFADAGQLQDLPGVLIARVPLMRERQSTLYMQLGPYLPVMGFVILLWSIAFYVIRPRRVRRLRHHA